MTMARRSRLPTLAIVAAGLLLAAALAAWQGPRLLPWDRTRTTIEAVASAGIGRPVRIAGPIGLSLLPEPVLRAADVTVADTGDGAGASVAELRMRVGLVALLLGRVEPQDLVLRGAAMRLPWPLAGSTLRGTLPPNGLHARLEDGTLTLGTLSATAIAGELTVGGPTTALAATGLATVLGQPWRMTGRLGRAGADGSATVEISIDGQEAASGTGGALDGQVAADGSVSGRVTGRGSDLSVLLPAPPQPWTANGRLTAGGNLVVADDLETIIGGTPARGAVALRILPQLRLDAALAANRLDLDAWLPPLLHGGAGRLPTGIDLSAEAASLAGGTLRHLRAGLELTAAGTTLRDCTVLLPGDAALQVTGTLAGQRFDGGAHLTAPDLPQTLAWLSPRAPALLAAAPFTTLHAATLAAAVQVDADAVAFDGLDGTVDGIPVAGTIALTGGTRPAVAGRLTLHGPTLDGWLPSLADSVPGGLADAAALPPAVARWAASFDADLAVTADHPNWHGTTYDEASFDGIAHAGSVELRQAALRGAGTDATLSGTLDGDGRIGNARLAIRLAEADALARHLPPSWRFAGALFHGPVVAEASADGPPGAWSALVRAEAADLRLQAAGRWDLPARHWTGAIQLHHPGAPRLLDALGLPRTADWVGDGSLSLQAGLDAVPGHLSLSDLAFSAGGLNGTGDVALAWPSAGVPGLNGSLDVDTLALPLPSLRSMDPLPFDALGGFDATLAIHAAHLLWGERAQGEHAPGEPASARVGLAGRVLRLDGIAAHLSGGLLTGQAVVDATGLPTLHAAATLANAALDGPVFGAALDLSGGKAGLSADITASGHSPAALFASLAGTVRAQVQDGALAGLDAARVLATLGAASPHADPAALSAGITPFTRLDADGTLDHGLLTLGTATLAAPAATIAATGIVDGPAGTMDLDLALTPAMADPPPIGLRLTGPIANPSRSVDLAGFTRWLAAR